MCMRDEPILASNQIGVILARVRPSGTDMYSSTMCVRVYSSTRVPYGTRVPWYTCTYVRTHIHTSTYILPCHQGGILFCIFPLGATVHVYVPCGTRVLESVHVYCNTTMVRRCLQLLRAAQRLFETRNPARVLSALLGGDKFIALSVVFWLVDKLLRQVGGPSSIAGSPPPVNNPFLQCTPGTRVIYARSVQGRDGSTRMGLFEAVVVKAAADHPRATAWTTTSSSPKGRGGSAPATCTTSLSPRHRRLLPPSSPATVARLCRRCQVLPVPPPLVGTAARLRSEAGVAV